MKNGILVSLAIMASAVAVLAQSGEHSYTGPEEGLGWAHMDTSCSAMVAAEFDRAPHGGRSAPKLCENGVALSDRPAVLGKITARHRAASRISQGEGQTANQRICAKAKIRKKLEHSLAQERPVSVNHIAQSLGYVNGGPFRLEFPELCRAIGKKQAALKRGRLRDAERVLRVALEEDAPPSATELSKRLEYASLNVLRHNFPELYATLLARRAPYQAECRRKIHAYLLGILAGDSAPQVLEVCEKIRLSPSRAYVCYPELCHAIATKHRQFEKALRVQRRARLRDEVFRVVSKLYEHGEYPSYSRVQATLNVDSLGDSRSIREFVQQAKQELNVRFPYSDSEGIPR